MSNRKCPDILIVGAGAVGVAMGYHLSLAGANIRYLVRPHRVAELNAEKSLYCYDDHSLKSFSNFTMVGSVDALTGDAPDFILLTLDGAQCRTASGTELLSGLGARFKHAQSRLIICGVGVGLRDHIQQATGFSDTRLLTGTLGMLCYQVQRAALPLHLPTDSQRLQSAEYAYRHLPDRTGFMLAAYPHNASRAFARLYTRCGESRCRVMPTVLYNIITNMFFPFLAACELTGWSGSQGLLADRKTWELGCRAQNEIMALPEHGLLGKVLSKVLTPRRHEQLLKKMEADFLPLDYHGFNQFHHGGKVRDQDIQVMENCLASGQRQGKPMPALEGILRRITEHSHVTQHS